MTTINEAIGAGGTQPIHDALVAGVDVLGQNEQVTFYPYVRTVLPLDGFVFWLNANLLTPTQCAQHGLSDSSPIVVDGSLHYASIGSQTEDQTIVVRSVDFTAETEIQAFATIDEDVMYVATWQTSLGSFQFTFSRRNNFYAQANIFHYVGDAIYPVFQAQLIDTIDAFDQRQVVSNSLPLWLAMIQAPPFPSLVTTQLSMYPAFHVPDNLRPPYASVLIPENSTRALQAVAWRDANSSRWQLVAERAVVTTYGLRNEEVMDFLDYTLDYSMNTGNFGLMNAPVVRDAARAQVELAALAQKKVIDFEVSYYQQRSRDVARALIASSTVNRGALVVAPDSSQYKLPRVPIVPSYAGPASRIDPIPPFGPQ